MAVALEFINFLVPIATIHAKYPGGLEKCLEDHRHMLGGKVWFDDHLFRDGAMSPSDMKYIVEEWERLGFEGRVEINGQAQWKDFCVAESLFGVTLPCDWVVLDGDYAYLAGTEQGPKVGPAR